MITKKKAEFDPLSMIGIAVITLFVLVLLIIIFNNFFKIPIALGKCEEYGRCVEKTIGCGPNEMRLLSMGGCSKSQICCRENEQSSEEELQDLNPKQQKAVENAIIVSLNNDPTPIADRSIIQLKVGMNHTFNIQLNQDLKTLSNLIHDKCAVYIKDNSQAGRIYYYNPSENNFVSFIQTDDTKQPPYLIDCKEKNGNVKTNLGKFNFAPSMQDVYKGLELYVIVFRNKTDETGEESQNAQQTSYSYSDTNNWFAVRTYRLNVEPVIKITGVSGTWVDKDDITLSCTDITCTKFGLKLVKLKQSGATTEESYKKMIEECKKNEGFSYDLAYLIGVSSQQTGIPLNINIGGFRLPIGQQKVVYQTGVKPIIISNNQAQILIDKATMISTFYQAQKDPDLFVGDTTYLCVEATTKDNEKVYALSKNPLKVDVLPPYVDQDKGILVIYPDRLNATITGTFGGTYYYREYPKVRIAGCYDFGQSGCSNYDYYIHPGEFIKLNSITGDIGTGITALILTEGLNMLFNALAAKDPLNTICPFIFSTDYRPNTNPEIRFPYRGQGIMCIRISDRVGNKELYWKALWLPDEMFNQIMPEAANTVG